MSSTNKDEVFFWGGGGDFFAWVSNALKCSIGEIVGFIGNIHK